ncbi:hypothetical protein PMSD_10015 [Paenibacillus macquariensis subsp. defensor]|nr:hypothetical protein PMSD_10015 [Paenibacillus macquariensis subsp. defensor]
MFFKKTLTPSNTAFLLWAYALDREVYSSDTFNQLSLATRFLRSLKLFERQECQTLDETAEVKNKGAQYEN